MNELVIILDFGGQYSRLIARKVRDCGVYCEVLPYNKPIEELKAKNPKGIIFTGGPNSVYAEGSPLCPQGVLELGVPVLGICYGAQVVALLEGGKVSPAIKGEYGKTKLSLKESLLFSGANSEISCWMSHNDSIAEIPAGYTVTAFTNSCPVAAMENAEKGIYAVQFHPEVDHTDFGAVMLQNFLMKICKCSADWVLADYVEQTVCDLKRKIGDKKVLCALSGGVDSTVAAVMVHKAVGKQLTCIFVDHGLLRKNEGDMVEALCKDRFQMNVIRVNAQKQFLDRLSGVTDPEQKRKIIGEEFIRIFENEAKKIGAVSYLVQGTIYPDVIESGVGGAAVIKSHHNVGGLPEVLDFEEIIEPLRLLFKDEVRKAGLELGIDEDIVWRQPFPGPGLGVRVIGEITEEKLNILREADAIFREEIIKAGLNRSVSQYFAALTNMKSVGVMGDGRTYQYAIALRAVTTSDFMTADFARIPYEVLETVSSRIPNEVPQVNRILYDITPKPPATIEYE